MKLSYQNQVRIAFPYPISSMYTKLGTDECLDSGPLRFQYLWKTNEAICRFLGTIVLCECRNLIENNPNLASSFPPNLLQSFQRPTGGIWLQIIREGLKYLHQHQATLLMPELYGFYFNSNQKPTEAATALNDVLTQRNAYNHDTLKALHTHEFDQLCQYSQPLIETTLEALDFLLDYQLVFISQVKVEQNRKQPSDYQHYIKNITGANDDFLGTRNHLNFNMDTQATLLLNPESKRYLNLDPLLVYDATAGKAPDVFFYNGMKNPNNAEYSACKHGEKFNSSQSTRAPILSRELQQLLDLLELKSQEVSA